MRFTWQLGDVVIAILLAFGLWAGIGHFGLYRGLKAASLYPVEALSFRIMNSRGGHHEKGVRRLFHADVDCSLCDADERSTDRQKEFDRAQECRDGARTAARIDRNHSSGRGEGTIRSL